MGKARPREDASTRADRKFDKKVQFYTILNDVDDNFLASYTVRSRASISQESSNFLGNLKEVKDTVASLSAQKAIKKNTKVQRRKKKLQAYDLSSLAEFLPEFKAPKQPKTELKLNSKTRQKLVENEGNKLKAVLSHHAFQSNPLQAIYQHLQGTQPLDDTKTKRDRKKTKGKGKKKKSKPQLMET